MRLRELLSDVPDVVRMRGNNPDIGGIATHSGGVKEGDVFVALSADGDIADRHPFIFQAIRAGARAVIAERDVNLENTAFVQTANTHRALAHIAHRFYNKPSEQLKMIGVTGTNGKTSTVYLIRAVLDAAGFSPGLIGTIEHDLGTTREISHNSTPQAHDLHRMFRAMVNAGCRASVMEVTSHGLAQNRVLGIDYEVAIFTNLTRDHLDYHNTPDAYLAAKARLFDNLRSDAYAVVNTDDAASKILIQKCSAHLLRYGRAEDATVRILEGSTSHDGTRLCLQTPHGQMDLELELRGDFSIVQCHCGCHCWPRIGDRT